MSSESRSVQTVFHEAVENHHPDQWPVFLDSACGTDDVFRRQVQRLLDAHIQVNSFMAIPAGDIEAGLLPATDQGDFSQGSLPSGTMIGRYKLLEQIGEGGMGVVYVAEQSEPVRRRVAVKIIKPGMDSREVISRFEVERQALAIMDHPNIARVLDAGTTTAGLPYFVMELVRGLSITAYCDKARLTPRQRLELFVTVCQAVQHAHLKGIIHRDLKPSNVMITLHDGIPVVKVIDFGVAKAVNQRFSQHSIYTAFSQILGTPLYMSPEQAELSGLDIDTRSDVYSLGVLLYELLTGLTPFDRETFNKAGLDEKRRMIREDEPARPSRRVNTLGAKALSTLSQQRGIDERRLSQFLRSELDWIVMKALEKDRTRRYESASAFAADVQRYLDDEPVLACPPSTVYRLRKLAGKHRVALGTLAAVGLAMIIGTGISVWQALEANQARKATDDQRKIAEADFDKALEAVDRLLARVGNDSLDDVPGIIQVRSRLIEDAMEFYRELDARRPHDPRVHSQMAAAQIRSWGWKWVGRSGNRVAEIQESIAVLEQLDREHSADPSVITILGDGYLRLGQFGPVTQKTENLQKGRRILEAGLERHPDNARIRDRLADLYGTLSSLLPPAEGEILLQEVITLCQPLTYENRGIAAWAMAILAERHASRNELTAAIDLAQRGIETRSQAVEAVPTNSIHRIALAGDLVTCARLLVRDGRIEEAASLFREAVRHSNQTMRENPGVLHYRDSHTGIRQAFSSFINEHGQPGDREALLAEHNERLAAGYIVRSLDYVNLKDDVLRMADVLTALKLDPDNLDAINAAYVDQLQRGEVDDAKALARRAVAVPQDRVNNWTLCGEQFQLLGEFMQAILAFDKASEDEPPQWHIVKRRGVANFFSGRYDEALSDMTYALSGKPDDISTLLWIDPSLVAACPSEAFRNGMLRLADEAVEVNQGAADHRVVRGVLRASMGRWVDAQADFDAAIASPSATAYSLYVVALTSLSNDDHDAYRAACESLCDRFHDSQDSDALHWAVWTCALKPGAVEDYDGVTALARRALGQQATEQNHLLGLGAVLLRAGQFEEAKQHLSACAEAPNSAATCPAYVWYFLAMTNLRLGHHDEARKWLDKASEFTSKILIESKAGRYRLFWNRRVTLELLDAEAKALLVSDKNEVSPQAD